MIVYPLFDLPVAIGNKGRHGAARGLIWGDVKPRNTVSGVD